MDEQFAVGAFRPMADVLPAARQRRVLQAKVLHAAGQRHSFGASRAESQSQQSLYSFSVFQNFSFIFFLLVLFLV